MAHKRPIDWAREAGKKLELDLRYTAFLEDLFARAIDEAQERTLVKGYELHKAVKLAQEYRAKETSPGTSEAEYTALGMKLDAAIVRAIVEV